MDLHTANGKTADTHCVKLLNKSKLNGRADSVETEAGGGLWVKTRIGKYAPLETIKHYLGK